MKLSALKNTHRPVKTTSKRVGRGIGSGKGKTCARGYKGAKSRSGYKKRWGDEGGQRPVFRKIPIRGFTRGGFREEVFAISLHSLERYFDEKEVVNLESLQKKKLVSSKKSVLIKVLGNGDLRKPLTLEVDRISTSAREKVEKAKGTIKLVQ